MNKWNPERAEAIRRYIDEYFMENHRSLSVREIAAGTNISKTAMQRYLTDTKEHGEIEYNGRRSIGTNLKNRRYIGEYCFRNIVTLNGISAIVPTDLLAPLFICRLFHVLCRFFYGHVGCYLL